MGKLSYQPYLEPQMADAVRVMAEIAAETAKREGLKAANPLDASVMRTYYNADRAYWNEGAPEMAESRDFTIDGPHGDIPLRLHRPKSASGGSAPCMIFIHGGGWVVGNLDTHDRMMRVLAEESGWSVLGVDYSLSPEAKFPVALDECRATVDWVRVNGADHGLDASRMTIGGDSAGANMSASLIVSLRDDNAMDGVLGGLLFYGAYGLRDSASRRLWGGAEDGLSAEDLDFYRDSLLNNRDELNDPRFDVLANDLSGLPPLLILEVVLDPLADDSVALRQSVEGAGGAVTYLRVEGVLHGYLHMSRSVDAAKRDLDKSAAFMNELLV